MHLKKIDLGQCAEAKGSGYPAPFAAPCAERIRRRVGNAAGLTQFGVNLLTLPQGCWSSRRHWHTHEDEFVYVLEGEVVMVTDAGEEILRAGDCAGFNAGDANGHHLQNRSAHPVRLLEVGSRRPAEDEVYYPGLDLKALKGGAGYVHLDGSPYEA